VHTEDADHAEQYFYPLTLLAEHVRPLPAAATPHFTPPPRVPPRTDSSPAPSATTSAASDASTASSNVIGTGTTRAAPDLARQAPPRSGTFHSNPPIETDPGSRWTPALATRLDAPRRCRRPFVFPPRPDGSQFGARSGGPGEAAGPPGGVEAALAGLHAGHPPPAFAAPFHPDNPFNWPW
jgi:hypothetical protein